MWAFMAQVQPGTPQPIWAGHGHVKQLSSLAGNRRRRRSPPTQGGSCVRGAPAVAGARVSVTATGQGDWVCLLSGPR
jgi:hypothetical protein